MADEDKNVIEQQATEKKAAEEKLLETSRTALDKAFGDAPNPDESQKESTSEQSKEEQSEESTSEQKDDEQTDETDTTNEADKTDDTGDSKADDKPKLTQAEIRAAIHLGWSEEEIKELEQANPGLAKKTCAKALESTNNLSKKFSELGKAKAEKPAEPEPKLKPEPKPKSIDFTALEREYENDPIVGILKQVVEQNQTLANEVSTLRTTGTQSDNKVSQAQAQEDAAIAQQIDVFFAKPDIVEYKDVYGEVPKGIKDWDALTQGQIKKRWAVVEQANLILLGAKQQGMDMPLDEAFERAHLLVTEDVREQTIRNKIKKEAVKRSKAVSFEPSNSKKTMKTGAKTITEIRQNAKTNLQKVFRS